MAFTQGNDATRTALTPNVGDLFHVVHTDPGPNAGTFWECGEAGVWVRVTPRGVAAGPDAARPASLAALGDYLATDTLGRYAYDPGTGLWTVASVGGGPDRATLAGMGATGAYLHGTNRGTGQRGGFPFTLAASFYFGALGPGAGGGNQQIFFAYSDNASRGWQLEFNELTVNRVACNLYCDTPEIPTDLAIGPHKVAFAFSAPGGVKQVIYSLDGVTSAPIPLSGTPYVPPALGDNFVLGIGPGINVGLDPLDGIAAAVYYATALSADDLTALTSTPGDYRLNTPAGRVEEFAFRAALALPRFGTLATSGTAPRLLTIVGNPTLVPH